MVMLGLGVGCWLIGLAIGNKEMLCKLLGLCKLGLSKVVLKRLLS